MLNASVTLCSKAATSQLVPCAACGKTRRSTSKGTATGRFLLISSYVKLALLAGRVCNQVFAKPRASSSPTSFGAGAAEAAVGGDANGSTGLAVEYPATGPSKSPDFAGSV
jgi:hypothetical protein